MTYDDTVDNELFQWLRTEYPRARVAGVKVEDGNLVVVRCTRVSAVVGKSGAIADEIEAGLRRMERFSGVDVELRVVEIARPEIEPVLVADHVHGASNRAAAVEMTAELAVRAGAKARRLLLEHGSDRADKTVGALDEARDPDAVVERDDARCSVWIER